MLRAVRESIRPWHIILALAAIAAQAAALALMGRLPICACGTVKLWHGAVMSAENSQHLGDWYSLSHVTHGLLFYAGLVLVAPRWAVGARLAAAVGLEAGWEVLENTDLVIQRYRSATIALDYYGDSIVNSLADTLFATTGFVLAWRLAPWLGGALAVAFELIGAVAIRDNLTLNILMLLWPSDVIAAWQAGR